MVPWTVLDSGGAGMVERHRRLRRAVNSCRTNSLFFSLVGNMLWIEGSWVCRGLDRSAGWPGGPARHQVEKAIGWRISSNPSLKSTKPWLPLCGVAGTIQDLKSA